jgi:hypothetical protein
MAMRVIVGAMAVLGLSVAAAGAQQPAPRERAAVLKPPVALPESEAPLIARGAAEGLVPSPNLGSTPVTRRNAPSGRAPGVAGGPDWLSGGDPNVLPAAGLGAKSSGVRTLSPAAGTTAAREQPSAVGKGLDKLKGVMPGGARPQQPGQHPPLSQPFTQHAGQPQPPTASTPFRGTTPGGAPVYAGPPAYRWYGWGTVTPGANAFAPDGQYPKASANWYSITGATPGAFPVPVMNPTRPAPGAEPPVYAHRRPQGGVQPAASVPAEQPDVVQSEQPRGSKFMPAPGVDAPIGVPTITTPPGTRPVASAPPPAVPYVAPVEPVRPVEPAAAPRPLATTPPSALPNSVTEEPKHEQPNWQPAREPGNAPPGTWAPAGGATQPSSPADAAPNWSGDSGVRPAVVRGQLNDNKPDPVATLIRQVCQGRADGLEIRWTGSQRLTVCFEVRGAADAQRLVNDISKRPELGPYQIDFCVTVK